MKPKKIRDFQFLNHLFATELNCQEFLPFLDVEVVIQKGEPDAVIDRGTSLLYSSPSSLVRFLHQTAYVLVSRCLKSEGDRDSLSLLLLCMAQDYVHHGGTALSNAVISLEKLLVPGFLCKEILSPLTARPLNPHVVFLPCHYTDSCRWINSLHELSDEYPIQGNASEKSFPAILCNRSLKNDAARDAGLLVSAVEDTELLRKIISQPNSCVSKLIVQTLFDLSRCERYTIEFLMYMNAAIDSDEQILQQQMDAFSEIGGMNVIVKEAQQYGNPTVQNQWSQISMITGLIEKQLGKMRGSMWPVSEKLKPQEDLQRRVIKEIALRKNKQQLNMEELLEAVRDYLNQNAVEPGQLLENVLKSQRIW